MTGVAVFSSQQGGWIVAGGTSVGAPLIAAAYALADNGASPAYSYAHPGAFHIVGSAGYNLATGLGSPNGVSGF
jgi:subtilase family serine protease